MKRIIALLCLMLLVGCEDIPTPVNFTDKQRVIEKHTDSYDNSTYVVAPMVDLRSYSGLHEASFIAPYSFAKPGDIIHYKDGVIKVIMTDEERKAAIKVGDFK